jgi:hypothetical protein
MPNPTLEQIAEETINSYFGTPLTTEEHTLTVQIIKEIYLETESKALALGKWRARVNQFEQDLHTRLSQADTPSQRAALRFASLFLQYIASEAARDIFSNPQEMFTFLEQGIEHAENFLTQGETAAGVREQVLILYINAVITLGAAPFNDAERQLEYEQRGLEHAENFLTQGETAAGVREQVLILYDGISTLFNNSGQKGLLIQHLPALGFWSWISLAKVEKQAVILDNWKNRLETAPAYPDFTAAFHAFLHTLLLKWHCSIRPHRHSISTETLLAISEGLYGLEQAKENQRLKTVYRCLEDLDDSGIVLALDELSTKQADLNKTLVELNALEKLSLIQKIHRWFTQSKLRKLSQEETQLPNDAYWLTQVEETETALIEWFKPAIKKQLPMPSSLDEPLPVLLGILLANAHLQTETPVETILDTWQQHPPWQNAETLQTALPSDWQEWAENTNAPVLEDWIENALDKNNPIMDRLKISGEQMYFEQPDLQKWFNALKAGEVDKLATQLQNTWETAKKQAEPLARILTALADPDFQGNLLDSKIKSDIALEAFAAVILGDALKQVRQKLKTWLQQQGALDTTSIPNTLKNLKHRLTRAVTIYEPSYPPLGDTVHEWAKVRLKEVLATAPEPESVWALLERARIGLMGLTMTLPEEWDKELGEALWSGLRKTMDELRGGDVPAENAPWLPIKIWCYQLTEWTKNRPPDFKTCQTYLQPNEVLVQPFFDQVENRLRILWLDKKSLIIRDLTDNCVLEPVWKESLITEWMDGLKKLNDDFNILDDGGTPQDLEKVMDSEPVQTFANQLRDWAETFTQITIIFPAPLGQLPWETLPQLENKLVREISVAHWLKLKTAPKAQTTDNAPKPWVVSDPANKTSCMIKEAQWVAHHLNTNLQLPCPSVFDALQHFAHSQYIHLSIHGNYVIDNPLKSSLSLETEKGEPAAKITLPLWTLSNATIPANLVILSACESNLNGVETEGLLTPVGIGPTIAAAGAKTVVGTLWSCSESAALCFSYYFYQIAEKAPNLPWHQIVAQARQTLKETTQETLKTIAEEFDIDGKCANGLEALRGHKPFKDFHLWAGFVMLGETARGLSE